MSFAGVSRRTVLTALGAMSAWPASAQTLTGNPQVEVRTDKGSFVLELYVDKAPITAGNFLRYVDQRRFDGASVYRASRVPGAPTTGLIEGGLQNDPARLYPPIALESTQLTGLSHRDGTISMAREAFGQATADFFICSGPAAYLDARPGKGGDEGGYAAFGQVVQGMDVVRAILALPTTGLARNPVMRGQILDPPVAISSMSRSR